VESQSERTNLKTQTTDQLNYTRSRHELRPLPRLHSGRGREGCGCRVRSIDLETKRVTVTGEQLDDEAVRAAIDEAGYDVA
jgi:copper chaperone CopZ